MQTRQTQTGPTQPKQTGDFLALLISRLELDPRILGVAAEGSWGSQAFDEFSDLDLIVLVEETRLERVLAEMQSIAHSIGPCLSAFPADHLGIPNMLIALYEEPLLHVDLKFVSPDAFRNHRTGNPAVLWERDHVITRALEGHKPEIPHLQLQWLEDRFWVWMHYATAKLGRGELFTVISALDSLRTTVLGPMLALKAHRSSCGLRRIEQYAEAQELAGLRATLAGYGKADCANALKACAKLYVGLRETLAPGDLQRNHRAEMATIRYLHRIGEEDSVKAE